MGVAAVKEADRDKDLDRIINDPDDHLSEEDGFTR